MREPDAPSPSPTLDYDRPGALPATVPPGVSILLCLPMLVVGLLCVPVVSRPVLPDVLFEWFWWLRAFAMLCALVSMFVVPRSRTWWPWTSVVNIAINVPGLALCTFGVLRYVVLRLPH